MKNEETKENLTGGSRWLAAAAIGLGIVLFCQSAFAVHPYQEWADELGIDPDVSYDGTRVLEFKEGMFESTERRAPGKMYTEVRLQGMSSAVILREDLGKSYMLMPTLGFYKEDSLDDGLMQASNGLEFSKIEKEGRETILDFPSTKYKTRFKDNEGKGAGVIWVTDSGVPIKMNMIYSNKDDRGMRLSMEFTELNIREQDPAVFEVPPGLKPMSFGDIGSMMKMGGAAVTESTGTRSAYDTQDADLSTRQQACLEEAATRAAEQQKTEKKKRSFGKLMGSLSRTASRLGLDVGQKIAEVNADIYDANATAQDVAIMAEELGITQQDVDRCRDPQ